MTDQENHSVLILTTGVSVILGVFGIYLLIKSRRTKERSPSTVWIGLAVTAFAIARILHTPVIGTADSITLLGLRIYNLDYMVTMTCTTVALIYCAATISWVAGSALPQQLPHAGAGLGALVMSTTFFVGGLHTAPHAYLPDAFDGSVAQSIYWATIGSTIVAVGIVTLFPSLRMINAVGGPIRVMLSAIIGAAIMILIFSAHIVARVFLRHYFPALFPDWYVHHSRQIAMYLMIFIVISFLIAAACPVVSRWYQRIDRFRLLYRYRLAWWFARSKGHRNVFDALPVPTSVWQCWRASASPATAYRLLFEVAPQAGISSTTRIASNNQVTGFPIDASS